MGENASLTKKLEMKLGIRRLSSYYFKYTTEEAEQVYKWYNLVRSYRGFIKKHLRTNIPLVQEADRLIERWEGLKQVC